MSAHAFILFFPQFLFLKKEEIAPAINKDPALDRAFSCFMVTNISPSHYKGEGDKISNYTARCHYILPTGPLVVNIIVLAVTHLSFKCNDYPIVKIL